LQKEKEAAAAAEAASRKSSRPGKGRNPRLEREDEQIEIPKKVSEEAVSRMPISGTGSLNPKCIIMDLDPAIELDAIQIVYT